RDRDGLPAGLPRPGDRLRQPLGPGERGLEGQVRDAELRPPDRARHTSADHVPRAPVEPQSEARRLHECPEGRGRQGVREARMTDPTSGKPETAIPQPKPGDTGILAPGYTFTTLTDKLASI